MGDVVASLLKLCERKYLELYMTTPPSVVSKMFFDSKSPLLEMVGFDVCEYEGIKKKMFGFSAGFWGFNNFDALDHLFPKLSCVPFALQSQRRPNKYHINRKYYYRDPHIDKTIYTFLEKKIVQKQFKPC
jgi:hypothetical protein